MLKLESKKNFCKNNKSKIVGLFLYFRRRFGYGEWRVMEIIGGNLEVLILCLEFIKYV